MHSAGSPQTAVRGGAAGGAPRPPSGGIMESRNSGAAPEGARRTSTGARPVGQQQPAAATAAAAGGAGGYGTRPSNAAGAPATSGIHKPAGAPPAMRNGAGAPPASPAAGIPAGTPASNNGAAANPYGNSAYGGGGGVSGYGNMTDNYGGPNGAGDPSEGNGMNAYGSMYGMGGGGGDLGGGMGSMYGMGGPMGSMYGMGGPMGSMYGMGGPMGSMYGMGGPMGSMYGMGGPMGSMYGMGGPMGSMYGMNPMMGSMYGMGGGMGSMYGMGGGMGSMMMGRSSSFSSYGGGSLYGSMGGGSMMNMGSTRSIHGMWGAESGYKVRSRRERDMPTMAKMLKDDEEVDKRHLVTATQKMLEKEGKGDASQTTKPAESATVAKKEEALTATEAQAAKKEADKKETETKDAKEKGEEGKERNGARAVEAKKDATESNNAAEKATATVAAAEDTNAIHSIILIEDAKSDRVKVEKAEPGQKVVIEGPAGKPVECKATDVLSGPEADVKKSSVLSLMASHVKSGHNVCLIAIDTKETMTPLFTQTIAAFFTESLEQLVGVDSWKAAFSATAITGPNKYRDLAKPDAAPADIVFGSNPIFGPCIMEAESVDLKEVAAVEKRVTEMLAKKADPQEILFLQAIVHLRKGKDLFLCSINAFVLRSTEAAEAAAILDDRRAPVPVMRTAIGGATRTAVLVTVTGAQPAAAAEGDVLRVVATLGAKENLSPRSGNVPRFIEYTDEQIAKIEKDMPNLSGEAKERRTHMVEKMRTMASDAKELLSNPETTAKVYPIHTRTTASPSTMKAAAAPASPPQANRAAAAREVPAAAAAAAAKAPDAAKAPTPSTTPAKDSAALNGTAVAAVAPTAAPTAASPFSSIHRLVYMRDAKNASVGKAVEVVVGGETKAYDVDECIDCPVGTKTQPLQESKELERMAGILASGCNVAVLGAEHVSPAAPQEQMTWRYVRHLLGAVLTPPTPEMENEVSLHMSVLHDRDVVADLLSASTEQRQLVVATSPLFGPMVHNSTAVKVKTQQEMEDVVSKALAKAATCLTKEGSLIVMTAVVKQILKDDVRVASLFAVSAADMSPYKGVIERNPRYSRSIFTYALGGPASTALLISASRNMDQSELASSLSIQRSVSHMKVPAPRNGSVKEFVQYARDSLDRKMKHSATSSDPAEKEQTSNSMRRLAESLKDHEELLASPRTVDPRAYTPEAAAAAAAAAAAKASAAQADTATTVEGSEAKTPAADAATPTTEKTQQDGPRETPRQPQRSVKVQPKLEAEAEEKAQPVAATEVVEAEEKKTPAEAAEAAQPENATVAAAAVAEEKHADAQAIAEGSGDRPNTCPVHFLAVITQELRSGLQVKEGWSVYGSGHGLVVTDVEGPHTFDVDEVVVRQNRNSPVASTSLDDLRSKFLEGINVALLTADARGSSASLETVDRMVRSILSKLPPSNALYLSLCALKEQDNHVLDTLKEGDEYKPLEVASSPLFGPTVAHATFEKIDTADRFVRLMGTGLRKCGESRACVVLQLVKVEAKAEEQDVCVSSMLGVMCPGDIGVYRRALEQPVKERGLFSLALGGSCHTLYVAGLTREPVDEGCLLLPRLSQALKSSVRNLKPRYNSMRRFIAHTKGAVEQVKLNMERATSEEEKAKMQTYLNTVQDMVETSEAYLAKPADKIPPTYPITHRQDRREL